MDQHDIGRYQRMLAREVKAQKKKGAAFDPSNKEHKAIVISAILCADALGVGRLRSVNEMLDMNDISVPDRDELHRHVYAWGGGIK